MPTSEELNRLAEESGESVGTDESFVPGNPEGVGIGTRVKGSVEGAVAGAASGGAIAGVPGAVVGGVGGAAYGGVKPEQTIGAVEGLMQGLTRTAHFNAGEKDANTKLNQVNAKLDNAYDKWLVIKDPEFAKLNTPYRLLTSSINPSQVLENFKKDMLYKKEFASTPYAQILLTEKYAHLKNQGASSLERTVKYGMAKTFTSEDIARKVSGMSDEDKKENEDAYSGARVAGEVIATAAASKLLRPLQKTKLIAETGPKSSLLRKSVSGGVQSAAYGAGYEGSKQLLQPTTLKEKGKEVAKTAATFGVVGATLPVAGAVAGPAPGVGRNSVPPDEHADYPAGRSAAVSVVRPSAVSAYEPVS